MSDLTPSARYDRRGDLYADFPPDLTDHPIFPLLRHQLTSALAPEAYDWEPGGDTLHIGWIWARDVERTLRTMWPDIQVTAEANPGFGARAAELLEAVR